MGDASLWKFSWVAKCSSKARTFLRCGIGEDSPKPSITFSARGQLCRGVEARLDVDWNCDQLVEHALHFGAHHAEAIAERLRFFIVALGLDGHDVARKPANPFFDPIGIHIQRAVGVDYEAALVEQRIELDGDAFAVRLVDAE